MPTVEISHWLLGLLVALAAVGAGVILVLALAVVLLFFGSRKRKRPGLGTMEVHPAPSMRDSVQGYGRRQSPPHAPESAANGRFRGFFLTRHGQHGTARAGCVGEGLLRPFSSSRRAQPPHHFMSTPAATPLPAAPANNASLVILQECVRSALMSRTNMLSRMLDGPKRDIDAECGYAPTVTPELCRQLYTREGIGARVVNIYPDECWRKDPEVIETEDPHETTPFEKAWRKLVKRLKVWAILHRADRLSGIGRYGIILLGFNDGGTLNSAVEGVDEKGVSHTTTKKRKLLYLRVFDETFVQIADYERDPANPRFGQPTAYNINFVDPSAVAVTGGTLPSAPQQTPGSVTGVMTRVHWHRVIHLADERESSDVFGRMRMEDVWNRLYDLRKVLSSSGEGFWKGAFPGFSFEVDPTMTLDPEEARKQAEGYMDGLQRYFAMTGVKVVSLTPQVADPTPHFTTAIRAICASKGIPWRTFLGSEEAKLASAEDSKAWNERIGNRQARYVTPYVIEPFIERLIVMGVLPPLTDADEIGQEDGDGDGTPAATEDDEDDEVAMPCVKWPNPQEPTPQDKATLAKTRTETMNSYLSGGVDALMPPMEFFTLVMGYTEEEAEMLTEAAAKWIELTAGAGVHKVDPNTDPANDPNADPAATKDEPPAKKPAPKKPVR